MKTHDFVTKSEYHMYFLKFHLNVLLSFITDKDFQFSTKFLYGISKNIYGA